MWARCKIEGDDTFTTRGCQKCMWVSGKMSPVGGVPCLWLFLLKDPDSGGRTKEREEEQEEVRERTKEREEVDLEVREKNRGTSSMHKNRGT